MAHSPDQTEKTPTDRRRKMESLRAKVLVEEEGIRRKPSRLRSWPTREGFHFAFLISFILVGAIIRDVNLLVILAGVLVAMMLIQFRLSYRSMQGIQLTRRTPRRVEARSPFRVEIRISNPKRWLGSWLVTCQDKLYRIEGTAKKEIEGASIQLVAGHVPPQGSVELSYECQFPRRGLYRFGPLEASTRFPLGLTQAGFGLLDRQSCLSLPAIGELLPTWRELFRVRRYGGNAVRTQSAAGEGEFYGLRDYRVGDSPRWIHWRTSARRNELVVRQFEKQNSIESCILLDLFRDTTAQKTEQAERVKEAEEIAIEFLATLVTVLVERARATLSVAIAAETQEVHYKIRSRVHAENLLCDLAVAQATSSQVLPSAAQLLATPLRSNPYLLVISTRPNDGTKNDRLDGTKDSQLRSYVRWIDVSQGEQEKYFVRSQS